jgi:fluoroacetyl-CoA thioesterase
LKSIFKQGDIKTTEIIVSESDVAKFESGVVHNVYSTFALTRDAEWSGRLFVLDMKEKGEEGIGTFISVEHKSPAFVGSTVKFIATFEEITAKGEIENSFQAYVGDRLIAQGKQGQRILPQAKIDALFNRLK